MNPRVYLITIIVVCLTILPQFLYGQEKKELINAVQAYRKQFEDIQFDMIYKSDVINHDPASNQSKYISKIQSHTKIKNNLRYNDIKGWEKPTDEQPKHNIIRTYDGMVTREYQPKISTGSIESGKKTSVSMFEYVHQLMMWPKEAMAKDDPRRIVYDLVAVLENDETVIEAQTETIHGDDTVVLNYSNGAMKVWLDLKHGGIVRRMKMVRPDGVTVRTYDIPKLQENNGVFFPAKLQYDIYTEDNNTVATRMIIDVPETSLKINEGIEDEVFTFQFPPGTMVYDLVVGINYISGTPKEFRPEILDGMIEARQTDLESLGYSVTTSAPVVADKQSKTEVTENALTENPTLLVKTNSKLWKSLAFAVIVFLLGLIIIYYNKKRKVV